MIKELEIFEKATGAKINYDKTKGLWLGKWKNRSDTPMNIKWTNQNVKYLGIYIGNASPARQTFEEIQSKVIRRKDYWKQFKMCKLSKARVIEIFITPTLWYAAKFYPIPQDIVKKIQTSLFEYFNFPRKVITVSQEECYKLREDGGAKLINVQARSEALKVKWLVELLDGTDSKTHLTLITHLIGRHTGWLAGMELFFTTNKYAKRYLKEIPVFYKEAILKMTQLPFRKQLIDLRQEKVFFNPIFTTEEDEVLETPYYNPLPHYYTYGILLEEHNHRQNNRAYRKRITQVFDKIKNVDFENREDFSFRYNSKDLSFEKITLKILYREILKIDFYKAHHSLFKWTEEKAHMAIDWDEVWKNLYNHLALEETKSIIWEQTHLNEYNTFYYNKWR